VAFVVSLGEGTMRRLSAIARKFNLLDRDRGPQVTFRDGTRDGRARIDYAAMAQLAVLFALNHREDFERFVAANTSQGPKGPEKPGE